MSQTFSARTHCGVGEGPEGAFDMSALRKCKSTLEVEAGTRPKKCQRTPCPYIGMPGGGVVDPKSPKQTKYCLLCRLNARALYRRENGSYEPEKDRKRVADWRKKNPEKAREQNRRAKQRQRERLRSQLLLLEPIGHESTGSSNGISDGNNIEVMPYRPHNESKLHSSEHQ